MSHFLFYLKYYSCAGTNVTIVFLSPFPLLFFFQHQLLDELTQFAVLQPEDQKHDHEQQNLACKGTHSKVSVRCFST